MNPNDPIYYFLTFFSAFVLCLILTPAARAAALVLNVIDHPSTSIKTHRKPVPYLGGVAIFTSFYFSLLFIRIITTFPSGTLHSLRGIVLGGLFIFALGLVDDIKPNGLHYRTKFLFQLTAAVLVILFGIHIKFIKPSWLGVIVTIGWIVGTSNAFNLTDIMDGLASSIALVAATAFLFISLPTEDYYVNFGAAALAGSALGFLPYNLSSKMKIFMGDSGSLFLGFTGAALALGTSYTDTSHFGVLAPLLIFALPIYDTILVFYLRIRKGKSPFLGSKDHVPLRLEALGWSRRAILLFSIGMTSLFAFGAYLTTRLEPAGTLGVYITALIILTVFTRYILKVDVK